MRPFICLLLAAMLLCSAALALSLPQSTLGQQALAAYIERVNDNLVSMHNAPINSVFMCFPSIASMGVTLEDNAEVPEGVELTFQLYDTDLNTLQLRVNDPDLFAAVAAACIQAATPDELTLQSALNMTSPYASRTKKNPANSYEDTIIEQNGTSVRTYYAYYPNQYHDGANWLQLTLIFPLSGYSGAAASTPTPSASTPDTEYEGITIHDNYTHFEIFATPTPEPDSPAGETKNGL